MEGSVADAPAGVGAVGPWRDFSQNNATQVNATKAISSTVPRRIAGWAAVPEGLPALAGRRDCFRVALMRTDTMPWRVNSAKENFMRRSAELQLRAFPVRAK